MKTPYQILASLFFLISCCPLIGTGQIETVSGNNITANQIDSFLKDKMEALQIAGLSIAIINNKEIVYHRNLGLSNTETGKKIDEKTLFEAASLSKPLFAYFVMKIVDKGLLDLDTPLYKYLPNHDLDHDERYKLITARNVLNHTAGLPNWRYMTNKMSYLEILDTPGEQFHYSGEAYEYLANCIVHLAGGTIADLESMLQEVILEPLNMDHSTFVWSEEMNRHKAYGHFVAKIPNNRFEPLLARVSGGLHSNAFDFAQYLMALLKEEGLSEKSFKTMLQPAVTLPENNDIRNTYGVEEWTLGFARQNTAYGVKHSHGGNNGDFQSYFEFYQKNGIGYVFMTNSNKGDQLNIELNELLTHGQILGANEKFEIQNRRAKPIVEDNYEGVSLNAQAGSGFCWVKNEDFEEGIIEFDLRGNNEREKSFVGLAFHAKDESTYDCVYFRPYLFQGSTEVEENYMVQYISMPRYDWFNLRSEHPGVFEQKVKDAPLANDWFHVKLDIGKEEIKVFVNGERNPSLVCKKQSQISRGKIGFWVGNGSKGDFANLKITPNNS